jgi:hypothetical protein
VRWELATGAMTAVSRLVARNPSTGLRHGKAAAIRSVGAKD